MLVSMINQILQDLLSDFIAGMTDRYAINL